MRWPWLLLLGGCDPNPPHHSREASGRLAETPACAIFVEERFALVNLGEIASLEIGLPPYQDVWGREPMYYGEDEGACHYRVDGIVARVQFGGPIDEDGGRYRPVFVQGLDFVAQPGCDDECSPMCRDVAATSAAELYVWCLER